MYSIYEIRTNIDLSGQSPLILDQFSVLRIIGGSIRIRDMKHSALYFFLCFVCVSACTGSQPDSQQPSVSENYFIPSSADANPFCKNWIPEEEIMVFPMGKFKYQSTDNVGRLISVSGNMPESTSDVWAISPYNPSDRFHEGSLTTTIPSIQSAGQLCTGPFAAHSTDRNLAFYCLSGAIHFQVEKNGVDSISFKSAAGEALSGMAVFSFNKQNLPSYHDASQEESDSVLVKAPAGGFLEGKDYYAFCRPRVLSKGLIATVYTGQSQQILSFPDVTSVSRATLSDPILIQLKEELNPVSIISFADARMKADCVAALDKDQDGEVSVTEAAAVTSLEGIFKSQLYTSFDEFRYFTGIKAIPDNFFSGWIMLKSISFPDGLSTIGKNAFLRCGELEAISFGHGLTFVDLKAFSQCPKLKTAHIPSLSDWLAIQFAFSSRLGNGSPFATSEEGHLYVDGQEITVADIPAGQKIIHNLAFFNCKEITTVILPGGLEETGYMAFRGCDKLTRAEIQDIRDYLSIDFSKSSIFSSNRTGDIVLNGQVLKDLVVPEGCTTIFSNAFYNSSITSVKFPDSLKRIEDLAFDRCKSLPRLYLLPGMLAVHHVRSHWQPPFRLRPERPSLCQRYPLDACADSGRDYYRSQIRVRELHGPHPGIHPEELNHC